MKTYARGNNDAPSITKYGSPVRLDANRGTAPALRLHCAKGAPKIRLKKRVLTARLRPQGKNHRFRQQSGIFSVKHSLL